MEKFFKRNDIGIPIEYDVIAFLDEEDTKYVLYTDFISKDGKELNIYCGKYQNNKVVDIDEKKAKEIIQKFKYNEKEAIKSMEDKL